MRPFLLLTLLGLASGAALAQQTLPTVQPVAVTNTAANPVPVVGTVKLDGGVGTITGTVKSGDKNVTVFDQGISVSDAFFGNHGTGQLEVSDYKEVRVAISHGSCGPCGEITAAVFVNTAAGGSYQIDQFPVTNVGAGVAVWSTKTYTVPGSKLTVSLKANTTGTSNSVRVAVIGRGN